VRFSYVVSILRPLPIFTPGTSGRSRAPHHARFCLVKSLPCLAWPCPARTGIKLGLCDQYCENGDPVVISSVWEDAADKQLRRDGQPNTTPDGDSPNRTRSGSADSHRCTCTHALRYRYHPWRKGHPLLSIVVVTRWPCCLE
jgi:hypothetical protein